MGTGISILMYHQVGDFPRMAAHRSTYCHYRRFAAQMRYLHRFGYNVISLDRALAALRGDADVPPRTVVLTFDDGYENFYEYAYPELARHGFPAMVYLLSGFIGQPSRWFAADGRDTPPLMDAARIRQLRAAGIDFGSHGVSHRKLAEIVPNEAQREIADSRSQLSDLLGEPVRHFCYPYGSHNAAVVQMARDAGYASATTCVRGAAYSGEDPHQLPRKAISYGDSLLGYAWKLHAKNRRKQPVL